MLKRLFRTVRLFCQQPYYYFADTERGLIYGRFIREERNRIVLETDRGGPVPLTSVLKSSLLSCSEVCELVRTLRAKAESL